MGTMTLTPSISSIIEQLYRSYSLFTYARVATALALRFHWKEGDYSAIFQPHDLKVAETRAHLEDVESSEAITSTTSLNDFSSEIVSHSKTFGQRLLLNERVSDAMPVNVCEEFEDRYQLELCLPNIHQFSDLTISTDLKHPSEAGHQIIINCGQLEQQQNPLVLDFSFPIKAGEVETILVEQEKIIQFIVWKSIYEPRPSDWIQPKWSHDQLAAWESLYTQKDLSRHMSAQFRYSDLKSQALEMEQLATTTLNEVRETIRTIFVASVLSGHDVFVIQTKNAQQPRIDWYLLTHPPVLISPLGSPLLRITANDHSLAQKLVDQGRLHQQQAATDFQQIFSQCKSSEVYTIFIQSEDEVNLLRYLFRLNSSKIEPTNWPIDNVPCAVNSPWLSTFFCPLYVDQAGSDSEMEDFLEATRNLNIQPAESEEERAPECCTTCKLTTGNLKRCARCKTVKYCSVQCQRSDWSTHKLSCTS